MPEPSGFLLVDKLEGATSRKAAEAAGRVFGRPRRRGRGGQRFRIGHAGTLDPLATGLLVVLVGRGTRLQPFLQGLPKRYTATVRLGALTDSLDRDGDVTARSDVPASLPDLGDLAARFIGDVTQVPPVVSALKRGGRSLHALVRAGQRPEPPPARQVRIDRLDLAAGRWGARPTAEDPGFVAADGLVYELELAVECGAGTYVRSLARDLAEALGAMGHVHALRRTHVGPFDVADAVAQDAPAEALQSALRPLAGALPHVPACTLTAERAQAVRHGAQPEPDWLPDDGGTHLRLLDEQGRLVAVCRRCEDDDRLSLAAVFPESAAGEDSPCA